MQTRRNLFANALLALGALLIICCGLFTLTHLTDRVVLTVLIPGFVIGLILIGFYVALGRAWDRGDGSDRAR